MKINWKQKLSSRKFWTAAMSWLTSILAAFNVADSTIEKIVLIGFGVSSLCIYMLAESIVDRARAKNEVYYVKERADEQPEGR